MSREPPVMLESKSLTSEEFESRRFTEENIIAALNDDSTNTIGIFGGCRVGKTRMARVGPNPDLKKIAREICDYLSVRFEWMDFVARANELLSKLIMQETVLIILDDVREFLDSEGIGILLQKHNGLYRIIITSRFCNVCLAMGCKATFKVQSLTQDDITILFIKKFGNSIGASCLGLLPRSVAREQKVLPRRPLILGGMFKVKRKLLMRRYEHKVLRSAGYLCLNGDDSKNAVDKLISDGFKLWKQLDIGHSSMDVGRDSVLFLSLEFLRLEDLPLFKGTVNSQLPVSMFRELRNLKLYRLPALLHVCPSHTQDFPLATLRSIQISHCPKLRTLFSLSMEWNLMQLEEIRIEYCEMMEEIVSEQNHEDGKISNVIHFSILNHLERDTLPQLTEFCKNATVDFPQLREMFLQSLRKFKIFCPADSDLHLEGNGSNESNDMHIILNEKHLFMHHFCPFPSQYQCPEEDAMGEHILSHPQMSSQASGGNRSANLLYDIDARNLCLITNQNIIAEEDVEDSIYSYSHNLEDKRLDEDPSNFLIGTNNIEHIEEMSDDAKLGALETMESRERYFKDFILFCSVFPLNYEFTKDILVWQWIGGGLPGLPELRSDEASEEVCTMYFGRLLDMDYIVLSGHDYFVNQFKYKFGDKMTTYLQEQPVEPKFGKYLDSYQSDTTKVEHLSLTLKKMDRAKLNILKQYSHLQTLVICDCYIVDHLPSDIFVELKALKNLNLSHTNIAELPSSVEYLKELRFLDISKTRIGWLPETLCCASYLQTLKLDGCIQLERLPKCTSNLIYLRHLIIDAACQLQSMPIGMGKLSNLLTLSAYLVDEDDGCVAELKNMNKLRGSFCLLNLENVRTKEEASEACLSNKVDLRKIELEWSDLQDEKNPREEVILEYLQPPVGIHELKLLFYSGGVLPSWICNPSFSELGSIILYKCRYCCSLPSLGELPSLKCLSIIENNEVVDINNFFFRKQANQHIVAFPKLEKLSFDSMFTLEKWTGLQNGDFPSLHRLIIEYCPKFVGLPFLSRLNSLVHLEIGYCQEFSCLPEDGLPCSLESLFIKESPKFKAQCYDQQWENWPKVTCVPTVYIDSEKVTALK